MSSSRFNKASHEPASAVAIGEIPKVVLDTNVVLDWLLFTDPLLDSLAEAICSDRVIVLTHAPALQELRRVLSYDAFKLDNTRQKILLDRYRHHTHDCVLPAEFTLSNLLLPPDFPSCRDPDDQHFLALTYHLRARALVTRDKALLSLRKRALKFGVVIVDVRQLSAVLGGWIT
jgi:uncharacterized protein